MNYSTNATINMVVTGWQMVPACACGTPAGFRAYDRLWCKPCLDAENRRRAIAGAEDWLTAAFFAVAPLQRARLYKSLAATFHPDTGGEAALMVALNRVRERFPS